MIFSATPAFVLALVLIYYLAFRAKLFPLGRPYDLFTKVDWSECYPDAQEAVPHDAPEPRGESVMMTCFCDADHAGCL